MQTFKEFLMEATVDLGSIATPVMQYFTSAHAAKLTTALDAFEANINSTQPIYNPDYEYFKDQVNVVFQNTFYKAYYREVPGAQAWYAYDNELFKDADCDPNLSIQSIKKILAELDKMVKQGTGTTYVPLFNELKALATAYKALFDIYKAVKPRVVAGRKPKEIKADAKGNYVGRLGSKAAIDTVTTALKAQFTPLLDKFEAAQEAYTLKAFVSLATKLNGQTKVASDTLTGFDKMLMQDGFDFKMEYERLGTNKSTSYYTELKAHSFPPLAKKMAKRERDSIEAAFMQKNIAKLSNLVEQKGLQVKIDAVGNPVVERGSIQGSLKFTFPDSSSFVVLNKVIINYRYETRGNSDTSFYQYPTTFHDVVLPDGSKLKFPSEEKMISTFIC